MGFKNMTQINKGTGKSRAIRAPNKWKAPREPLVPPGKTTVVNVPRGAPGTTIQVPYPGIPGAFIAVNVPKSAKPGQAMLVPVPDAPTHATAAAAGARAAKPSSTTSGGWSTGQKLQLDLQPSLALVLQQLVAQSSVITLLSMAWMQLLKQLGRDLQTLERPLKILR